MNRHFKPIGIACLLLVAAFLAALAIDSMLLGAAIALIGAAAIALLAVSTMRPTPPARKYRPTSGGSPDSRREPTHAVEAD